MTDQQTADDRPAPTDEQNGPMTLRAEGPNPMVGIKAMLEDLDLDPTEVSGITLRIDQEEAANPPRQRRQDWPNEHYPTEPHGNETTGPPIEDDDRYKGELTSGTKQHLVASHLADNGSLTTAELTTTEDRLTNNQASKALSILYEKSIADREQEGDSIAEGFRYRLSPYGREELAKHGPHEDLTVEED